MESEIQKLVNALVAAVRKQVTAELDAKLASDWASTHDSILTRLVQLV